MYTLEEGCKLYEKISTWNVKLEVIEILLITGLTLPVRDSAERIQEILKTCRKLEPLMLNRDSRLKRG